MLYMQYMRFFISLYFVGGYYFSSKILLTPNLAICKVHMKTHNISRNHKIYGGHIKMVNKINANLRVTYLLKNTLEKLYIILQGRENT